MEGTTATPLTALSALKALTILEELRRRVGNGEAEILRALLVLARSRLRDAESVIRLHEVLLFLRAYPPSARVRRRPRRGRTRPHRQTAPVAPQRLPR